MTTSWLTRLEEAANENVELHAALSRALDLLERHQWDGVNERCPDCKASPLYEEQHNADCELAQLLKENGREVRHAG